MSSESPDLFSQPNSAGNNRRRLFRMLLRVLVKFLIVAAVFILWLTQPLWPDQRMNNSVTVNPARLETHVRKLSEEFFPREWTNIENLNKVAAYISTEFRQAGGTVSEQTWQARGATYRNIIATFGPDSTERVIVGAHYDSCLALPGADDNASGVAGLIELAHLLKQAKLNTKVELVAYSLEEPPFFRTEQMGSAIHAASLKEQNARVRAMIALEMIGYFNDAPNSQSFPHPLLRLFYPTTGNFIAVTGNFTNIRLTRKVKGAMRGASALPVCSINAPAMLPGIDFSDHLNYWNAGYDALMITDTSFFRNTAYHTSRDTPDRLDYKRMAMVVAGVYAAVLALSL